jgi:hypothetical protein
MTDHLESKNLVPFSKRRNTFQLPVVRKDRDEEMLEQVDPDLTPEDEGIIRRYLQYADTLLGSPDIEGLTLVSGSDAAKKPTGMPENFRQPAPAASNAQKDEDQNDRSEESEFEPELGGTDQAA